MSLALTKASIVFFYLRFPSSRLFKAACYLVLFIAVANGLTAGFSFLYLCQPIAKHWHWEIEGRCVNASVPFWVAAIVNMSTDVIILLLPVWLLLPLRLGPAKMLSVLGVMMAGGLYVLESAPFPHFERELMKGVSGDSVCGITIYRVVDIPGSMESWDVPWDYTDNYMWWYVRKPEAKPSPY